MTKPELATSSSKKPKSSGNFITPATEKKKMTQKSIYSFFAPSKVKETPPAVADEALVSEHDQWAETSMEPKQSSIAAPKRPQEESLNAENDDFLSNNAAKRVKSAPLIIESDDDDDDNDYDEVVKQVPKTPSTFKTPASKTPASAKLARFAAQQTPLMAPPTSTPGSAFDRFNNALPSNSAAATPRIITGDDRRKERKEKFTDKNAQKYYFLNDIKDADGHKPGDAEYDPRTLFIPSGFWKEATPVEKQYWAIKCKHFDTLVFFKKGKFYELFERDADIGQREFDLKLTDRAHMRMVGVPEASFEFWVSKFIARGYKVAKVDQLETAIGKEMRERDGPKTGKKDDIIRRELTGVLTSGTLVDGQMLTSDMSTYCLALKEIVNGQSLSFGVAFVDTATAEFQVCQFDDEDDRAQLETLLIQVKPKEVIFEKGILSQKTMRLLKNSLSSCGNVMWNAITPGKEFWDDETTLSELKASEYFPRGESDVPVVLKDVANKPLAISAFGGLVWYLKSLKLDQQLLSTNNIKVYDPIRSSGTLILDGSTLVNLEVFQNNLDGGDRGTLHKLLNQCVSPFGKRMFKKWLCHPLRGMDAINARLDAVEDFDAALEAHAALRESLKCIPDLERLISRIHSGSCRLKDFLLTLDGFCALNVCVLKFAQNAEGFKSQRLIDLCTNLFSSDAITANLIALTSSFDIKLAKSSGEFIVNAGIEEDYDAIVKKIKDYEFSFAKYLREQKSAWQCSELKYKDLGKELFQLEFPAKFASKLPADWLRRSSTKAVVRVHSPYLVGLVKTYQEAKESRSSVLASLFSRIMVRFDANMDQCWSKAVLCAAELDCLAGLATVSGASGVLGATKCRPEFVPNGTDGGLFEVTDLRHPCIMSRPGTDFIPNDIQLGHKNANMVLLTGPNMGGKSTTLRQTCIAIIMAQLGCFVPAASCKMTLFDRIFTRIGANDNILAGQSTFMVELSETSKILQQATPYSLTILDELGRGTSTFDGYAIAYSVLAHLSERVKCLGLFSTHYGLMTSEFSAPVCPTPNVRCMHMDCVVDEELNEVTFLYKLVDGVSQGSHGTHVARMAGVPNTVIEHAETKSKEMVSERGWIGCVGLRNGEDEVSNHAMAQSLMVQSDFGEMFKLMEKLKLGQCSPQDHQSIKSIWATAKARYLSV